MFIPYVDYFVYNVARNFSEALQPFFGDFVSSIYDIDLLSSKLYSEGYITRQAHKDITISGWGTSTKASRLLLLVTAYLKTSKKPLEVLKGFCRCIKDDPILKSFIPKIEDKIGGI